MTTDDFGNTIQENRHGTLAIGSTVTGVIETIGDQDWFAVELVAGKTYQFDLERSGAEGSLRNPYFRLYDGDGNLIEENNNGGDGRNSRLSFQANKTGTYYASAGGNNNRTGTYTLSVVVIDDFSDSSDNAKHINIGERITGTIETGGDQDWFAVELVAGETYQFDLKRSGAEGSLRNPYFRLYDGDGNLIEENNNGGDGRDSRLSFQASKTGTYYASAGGNNNRTGTYTLSVEVIDDFSDSSNNAKHINIGERIKGAIETGGDQDWFSINLTPNSSYQFDLTKRGGAEEGLQNPYFRLYNSSGDLIGSDDNGGDGRNSQFFYTLRGRVSETVYISASGHNKKTGTYSLSVVELTEDIANNSNTVAPLQLEGRVISAIDWRGDEDWFSISLKAGETYRFDLESISLWDPYFRLYDSDGELLGEDNNGGNRRDSLLYFKAEETGTYYGSARSHKERLTGAYTMGVFLQTDDFSNDRNTIGELRLGGTLAEGQIETEGDEDWFAVQLTAESIYQFDLLGISLNDPLFRLYDSDGDSIGLGTYGDLTNSHSQFFFTAKETGTYYASARSNFSTSFTGDYAIAVVEVEDDFGSDKDSDSLGTVIVGKSVIGKIESWEDQDWFAVQLTANNTYQFDLEGYGVQGYLWDPFFRLYDSNEDLIGSNNNGGDDSNSRYSFTAEETGTYYASAGGYLDDFTGRYILNVVEVEAGNDELL